MPARCDQNFGFREITEHRNVLLRQMYHLIQHGKSVGSVLTLDGDEGDLDAFLLTFELNKERYG